MMHTLIDCRDTNVCTTHNNGCFWDNRRRNLTSWGHQVAEDKAAYDGNQNKVSGIQFVDMFGKWMVTTLKNHKLIIVGLFDKIEDAIAAWAFTDDFGRFEYSRILGKDYNPNSHIGGQSTDFHSRYYFRVEDLFLGLPSWYNSKQRCDLVQSITDSAPLLFEYHLPENNRDTHPDEVSKRLEIFASYIIDSSYEHKSGDVITAYKLAKIFENEIPMSCYIEEMS